MSNTLGCLLSLESSVISGRVARDEMTTQSESDA